jgi:hypothetical protein
MTDAAPEAVAATPVGDGRYAVTVDPAWSIGTRPHGGYLMALVLRAAVLASPHPDPISMSTVFLRPPSYGPATVVVEQIRSGRTVATHRARLIEDGQPVLEALVVSGRLPDDPPDFQEGSPIELPPLAECPRAEPSTPDGTPLGLMNKVELHMDPATMRWAGGHPGPHEPVFGGWVRLVDAPTDAYTVVIAADTLPPAVFALGARGWAPTVEMTTQLRARPADGWLRVGVRTALLQGGWFDEQAVVWDSAGRLVGQAHQLAMVGRPRPS